MGSGREEGGVRRYPPPSSTPNRPPILLPPTIHSMLSVLTNLARTICALGHFSINRYYSNRLTSWVVVFQFWDDQSLVQESGCQGIHEDLIGLIREPIVGNLQVVDEEDVTSDWSYSYYIKHAHAVSVHHQRDLCPEEDGQG